MDQNKNRTEGSADANNPRYCDGRSVGFLGFDGHGPESGREDKQNEQSSPLKRAPGLGGDMRLPATHRTYPRFPESEWQNRNPEDVPHIESAYLHRATRLPAPKAVVVAER
jgi:hypothetical protein